MPTRREFVSAAASAAGALGLTPAAAAATAELPLRLGIASYSLREFQRGLAIKMTKQLGVSYINLKEFHLPYAATPEERAKGRKQIEDAGLTIVGGGTIYFRKDDEADIKFYFDYAKQCGMPLMTIGATHTNLGAIEKFAKQYDIKVAIHNHGPEDKFFPKPSDALKFIKNMDPRMGLCVDVGHTTRTGADVLEEIQGAGSRVIDMHIKDLRDLKDSKSQVPVGEGAMPIPQIFRLLQKLNYKGSINLEYEIDADNPLLGMAKSISYMRGVLVGMKS